MRDEASPQLQHCLNTHMSKAAYHPVSVEHTSHEAWRGSSPETLIRSRGRGRERQDDAGMGEAGRLPVPIGHEVRRHCQAQGWHVVRPERGRGVDQRL